MSRQSALGIARQLVKRSLARMGYALVPRDHKSPVPNVERLDQDIWQTQRSMAGVDLAIDKAVELLTGQPAPYLGEFVRPHEHDGYAFATGSYPPGSSTSGGSGAEQY